MSTDAAAFLLIRNGRTTPFLLRCAPMSEAHSSPCARYRRLLAFAGHLDFIGARDPLRDARSAPAVGIVPWRHQHFLAGAEEETRSPEPDNRGLGGIAVGLIVPSPAGAVRRGGPGSRGLDAEQLEGPVD